MGIGRRFALLLPHILSAQAALVEVPLQTPGALLPNGSCKMTKGHYVHAVRPREAGLASGSHVQ